MPNDQTAQARYADVGANPGAEAASITKFTADSTEVHSKTSSLLIKKKRQSRGVPSTITSAIAARQHHVDVIRSTEKGLEILAKVIERLKSDEKKGTLTADLSHIIGKSNNVSVVDVLDSMTSVLDERSKSNIEFVLGVLGVTKVPEPLLERQRNQGQRAVITALRTKANQRRRELLKAAKRESQKAAKIAAMKAANLASNVSHENAEELSAGVLAVQERKVLLNENDSNKTVTSPITTPAVAAEKNETNHVLESEAQHNNVSAKRLLDNANIPAVPASDGLNESSFSGNETSAVKAHEKNLAKDSEASKEAKRIVHSKRSEPKRSRFSALTAAKCSVSEKRERVVKTIANKANLIENEINENAKVGMRAVKSSFEGSSKVDSMTDRCGKGDPRDSVGEGKVYSNDNMNSPKRKVFVGDNAKAASKMESINNVCSTEINDENQSAGLNPTSGNTVPNHDNQDDKHVRSSVIDEGESELSDPSDLGNDDLARSTQKSVETKDQKEVRKNHKRRTRPQRSEKGRFKSKSVGLKARTSMLKVRVFSEDEIESEDEIRPARSSTRNSSHPKSKGIGRKRNDRNENETEVPKNRRANSDQGNGRAGSSEEKKIDLSAYERTPREKRISGRRALLEDPADSTQRSGRLRRESNHLNHDDTESVLWQKSPYMGMCYRAWMAINTVAIAIPFREPVSSRDAPGYYDIIKKPMDLRTIRTRIMNGSLTTPVEFQRDLNQIVRNAMTYNAKDSDIYELATLFRDKMKAEVDPIVEAWKSKESGKTADVSEKVAEVQRLASAGPRGSARYPSRRARFAPLTERSPSPSPQSKRVRNRGKKKLATEKNETVETEDEQSATKRGGIASGRVRGRTRKSRVNDRSGAKEKEKTKASVKRRSTTGGTDDEPSSKRRRRTQE